MKTDSWLNATSNYSYPRAQGHTLWKQVNVHNHILVLSTNNIFDHNNGSEIVIHAVRINNTNLHPLCIDPNCPITETSCLFDKIYSKTVRLYLANKNTELWADLLDHVSLCKTDYPQYKFTWWWFINGSCFAFVIHYITLQHCILAKNSPINNYFPQVVGSPNNAW